MPDDIKALAPSVLEHRMVRIYREAPNAGSVLGIAVDRKSGGPIDIRGRVGV